MSLWLEWREEPAFTAIFGDAGDLAWQDRALCIEADPESFFPPKGNTAGPAKRVCARCEVTAECLEFALSFPGTEDFGVYGGTSEHERRRIRADRNRSAA